jgi:hypothetical protein
MQRVGAAGWEQWGLPETESEAVKARNDLWKGGCARWQAVGEKLRRGAPQRQIEVRFSLRGRERGRAAEERMLEEAGKSWLARIQTLHDGMMTWEEVLVEVARGEHLSWQARGVQL